MVNDKTNTDKLSFRVGVKNRHTSLCSGSVLHSCKRSPSPVDCIATNLLSSLCYNIPGGLSVGIETFGHNVVYSAKKEKT